jgi:hypothetical protein
MQKIKVKFELNLVQTFFIEKSYELLHHKTVDTFRLKINNSKSIIRELIDVCQELKNGKINNHDYAQLLARECSRTLESCDIMKFKSVGKEFFMSLLNSFNKEKYTSVIHCGKIILNENSDIIKNVFKDICLIVLKSKYRFDNSQELYDKLSKDIEFFYSELIYKGYSKHYLYKYVNAIFSGIEGISFIRRLAILYKLIYREDEEFNIIMGLDSYPSEIKKIRTINESIEFVDKSYKTRLIKKTNQSITDFFEENKSIYFFSIKTKSLDYYSALFKARGVFTEVMDVFHLGFSNEYFHLSKKAAVIGSINPVKSKVNTTDYSFDGFYNSKHTIYRDIYLRLHELDNKRIKAESINKLYAGIRYLRMGNESNEIEQKFINYWIGLEYVFSSTDTSISTIDRLREYFKKCHALIYIKRNLLEFHRELNLFSIDKFIPDYSDDLKYLLVEDSFQLINKHSSSPLLIQRANYYLERLKDSTKLKKTIEKHKQNIEWNLTRIYRIRNEIIHDAATKPNITMVTSHLRYYLTFILYSILDFLIENQKSYNQNSPLDIENYFVMQELILGSLETNKKGINMQSLIQFKYPLEILS